MKNIHVLPTEVFNQMPYQIWRNKDGGLWRPTKEFPINSSLNGKVNICITNNEEIKEGDWYITNGEVFKCTLSDDFIWRNNFDKFPSIKTDCKKIILTTDQDLIKDGVQAIDDEFLEWFVDNPSCESVEVKRYYETLQDGLTFDRIDYKIIIPKEEQKQHLIDMMRNDEELGLYDETEHLLSTQANKERLLEDVKEETQRMYSEEDMLKSFMAGIKCESNKGENFEQFIKQLKKK
jgi:hypothetical protein